MGVCVGIIASSIRSQPGCYKFDESSTICFEVFTLCSMARVFCIGRVDNRKWSVLKTGHGATVNKIKIVSQQIHPNIIIIVYEKLKNFLVGILIYLNKKRYKFHLILFVLWYSCFSLTFGKEMKISIKQLHRHSNHRFLYGIIFKIMILKKISSPTVMSNQ